MSPARGACCSVSAALFVRRLVEALAEFAFVRAPALRGAIRLGRWTAFTTFNCGLTRW